MASTGRSGFDRGHSSLTKPVAWSAIFEAGPQAQPAPLYKGKDRAKSDGKLTSGIPEVFFI